MRYKSIDYIYIKPMGVYGVVLGVIRKEYEDNLYEMRHILRYNVDFYIYIYNKWVFMVVLGVIRKECEGNL